MSVDRKEIDLIIRARLQQGKTLEGVAKSITEIEKALEAQTEAAKRGEASLDDLKATLEALKRAQDQLKDQAGLIGQFQRLSEQIATTAERQAKAVKAADDYKAKLDQTADASENQRNKLVRLTAAVERSQATLTRQRDDQAALAVSLREAGIATDDLAASENRVRTSAAQLGVAINKVQQSISTYADDVRAARAAEAKLTEDKVFQAKLEEAAKLNKAGEYVRFWTNALNDADVAQQQLKINAALRKTADEAVAAARGYKTLGTSAKSLTGESSGLRATIQGILEPATQARSTLAGVEAEIGKLSGTISEIKGPIADYRNQVQQLAAAQRAVSQQAGLVDSYARQLETLRQARAEFTAARAQVLQYAEALRNSKGENDQLTNSLRNAQATLATAQRNLAAQLTVTRELRGSMRQAGLSTSDLAATQARLTSAAQTSTNALRNLEAAHKRYGDATREAATSHDFFNNSGRTTLSLMQRVRGEILSLVAAYVGLYGAIGGAGKAIDAFNVKQGIQNQLALSAGNDNRRIAEEYEYIRQQADRIGISFESAAKGYAKFSAAATLAGRDSREIRYIFEAFSEVARVANLSKDDLDGVFKALEQIISKGTIQAEELRGQLGDRLFGAFQVAAQALKDQFPQLDKAMKNGEVTADQLLKIAEKYREMVGPRLSEATQNLSANQARLNSALFEFKTLIAESGFAAEFGKLVERLTQFFNSDDGTKFAKNLSDGLSAVAQGLVWIIDNLETVKTVLETAFVLYGVKLMIGFASSVKAAGSDLFKFSNQLQGAGRMMQFLTKSFFAFNAFAVGWQIGSILREKFAGVRLITIDLIVFMDSLWTRLKYSTMIIWAELPNIILDAISAAGNAATSLTRTILGAMSKGARGLGKNELADSIDKAIKAIEFRTDRIGTKSGQLATQMEEDLRRIRKLGDEMRIEAVSPGSTSPAAKRATGTATTKPTTTGTGKVKEDEKAAERRLKIKEQIEAELAAIDAKIEKQEKDSLESRLKAIDDSYFKLIRKITELGGKESAQLSAELNAKITQLKAQETKKFNDALLKEQTDLQRKLEQVDAQASRNVKTDLDRRLNAVSLAHEETYREIEAFRKRLIADGRDTQPADLLKGRLDAGVVALKNLERQKFYEDAINAILEDRKAQLEVIAVNEKIGLVTAVQAREQAAKVISDTQPRIEELATSGVLFAQTMRDAAAASGESTASWDTLISKLKEAQNSAKGLRLEFLSAQQVNEMLAGGATNAFETMAKSINDARRGIISWKDALSATRNAFLNFAADFLMEIGKMILKQALLNALQNATKDSSGGIGGAISGAVNALLKHDGGVIGAPGSRMRLASAAMFANAPRYHGGGIPGLASNEYPAILKKNEEVLRDNDPRNILNGGAAAGGGNSSVGVKVINMIDSGSVVSEGLSTQEGERAIFNFIRANRTGLKQVLS